MYRCQPQDGGVSYSPPPCLHGLSHSPSLLSCLSSSPARGFVRPLTSPLSNSPGGLVRRSWAARTLLGSSCLLPDSVGWGGASQHTPDDPGAAARGPDFRGPSFWGEGYGRPPWLPSPIWWSSLSRVPERDFDQCLQISPAGGCEDGLGSPVNI